MKKFSVLLAFMFAFLVTVDNDKFTAHASDEGNLEISDEQKREIERQTEQFHGPLKRSVTNVELNEINKVIEEELDSNGDFEIEEVLKELGLEDVGYKEPENENNDFGMIQPYAIHLGKLGFTGPYHTSTTFHATLAFTNLGTSKLDAFNAIITPYTRTSGGAFVQKGAYQYVAQQRLMVGTTILGVFNAPHSNHRGAKLEATGVITDKGKGFYVPPASAVYTPR